LTAEFDPIAEDYTKLHQEAIEGSGFSVDYFYEYKVKKTYQYLEKHNITTPKTILDFGCGVGNLIPYIREYFPDAQIYGCDISKESIELAEDKTKKSNASFFLFDPDSDVFPAGLKFDLVIVSCVFHHIPPEEHIKTLYRIRANMNPGGNLFIFEHNPYNPATRRVFKNTPLDKNATLLSAKYMTSQLEQSAFENMITNYIIFFPGSLSAFLPLESKLIKVPFGAQYFIAAKTDHME